MAVSILTYNRQNVLTELLDSLRGIRHRLNDLIVVDNCSSDRTGDIVNNITYKLKYIRLPENLGAAARNFGLEKADADVVITLDDDIIGLNEDSIETIINLFGNNPALGAVNFQIRDFYTGEICNWVHHKKEEDFSGSVFPTYEITEGAVAFRKEALKKAGLYAEDFFISHEGPDLACRILDCGFDIIYSGSIKVHHKHENAGRKNWYNYYYDTRNLFWLAARNYPLAPALIYIARGLGAMMIYSIRDGFFIFWCKGLKDGLLGLKRALSSRRALKSETMQKIREIDMDRPEILYLLKKRVLKKSARL